MGNYIPGPELTRRDGSRPETVQEEVGRFIEATVANVQLAGLEPEQQIKVLEAMKTAAEGMWPERIPPVIVESKVPE